MVFMTDYRLMQVKSNAEYSNGRILQYLRPSLSYRLSLRSMFCLFLSGCLRQILLIRVHSVCFHETCLMFLRSTDFPPTPPLPSHTPYTYDSGYVCLAYFTPRHSLQCSWSVVSSNRLVVYSASKLEVETGVFMGTDGQTHMVSVYMISWFFKCLIE